MRQKRFLSWIMVFTLLVGMFSFPAYAEGNTTTISGDGTSAQTGQMTVTLRIPDAPTAAEANIGKASITLTAVDGCEYKCGDGNYQDSNEFTGLAPGTAYTFYQRFKNTQNVSAGAVYSTLPDTYVMLISLTIPATPDAPTAASTTKNNVTLTTVSGCEYSMDGTNWQDSPAFSNLLPGTAYTFYQRVKATTSAVASASSTAAIISTKADTYAMTITLTIGAPTPALAYTGGSPTVTVPVSGEDATVNVKVEVKGDTATVKEADIDKVLSAEEVGTVTVDLSGLEANIDEATIPGDMVKKIADAVADEKSDADGLEIKLPAGSVTLDADALAAVNGQADGKDLTLHLDGVKVKELTSAQQDAVKDLEIEVVLDAYLTSGGKRISDFNGGSATVKIPYTLKDGQTAQGLVVWYVAADGTRTQVPASYDGKNVVFTVPHFSNYVIAYDAEKAAECPKDATCPISAFDDADPTAWYHDGVHFVLANGIMNGVGDNKFDPDGTTTRAMIVTILYRLEGEPVIRSGMPFSDVKESDWYAKAVSWAESKGIVNGFEDGTFRPNAPITREQLAAILYRYEQSKGGGFVGAWMFLLDYPDAAEISSWADEAMHWCVMHEIIKGKDGRLVPGGNATRAETATMLMRYLSA